MGQHLLYTDNDPQNPFACMLASDLYLPKGWAEDRERCRAAKIPDDLGYRAKWRIGVDQVESAIGNGVRFAWMTFDEDYGKVPEFWFEMDRLGQRSIGEVPANFYCWPTWLDHAEALIGLLVASLAIATGGSCIQAGRQCVPVQSSVPGSAMEAIPYQGHYTWPDDLGSQGSPGSPGRQLDEAVAAD